MTEPSPTYCASPARSLSSVAISDERAAERRVSEPACDSSVEADETSGLAFAAEVGAYSRAVQDFEYRLSEYAQAIHR